MPSVKTEWVALGYSVPASPSKARVFVWRRLRAINAQALRPGMALLPNTKENLHAFEELAKKIREFSGDAVLIEMNFVDPAENEEMRSRFMHSEVLALQGTLSECATLLDRINKSTDTRERETLKKELNKKLGRIRNSNNATLKGQADEIEQTIGSLFETLRGLPAEFAAMLKLGR